MTTQSNIPAVLNPIQQDQAAIAKHLARKPMQARKPQAPMDIGLFSDESNQLDLIEMFMD